MVKTLGDGAMASFESALGALRAAASIQAAAERLDADQGGIGIAVRVGVAVGEPISYGDDLHGMAVVIASRLCSAAASGEVLVQDLVGALVESRDGVGLSEARSYALKGLPAPVQAGGLHWRELVAAAQRTGNLAAVRVPDGVTARVASGGGAPGWPGQELDPVAPHSLSPRELKELLAAERGGEPFLAFRDGEGSPAPVRAGRGGGTSTIGRRAEMDLSIAWDGEVSGLHAELQCLGGEWTIVDDGLSHERHLRQRRAGPRAPAPADGDRIRVGRTVLAYNLGGAAGDATVTAGERPALPQLTDTQQRVLVALCRPYATAPASRPPPATSRSPTSCTSASTP